MNVVVDVEVVVVVVVVVVVAEVVIILIAGKNSGQWFSENTATLSSSDVVSLYSCTRLLSARSVGSVYVLIM